VTTHFARLTLRERLALPGHLRALLEAGEIPVEAYLDGLLALADDPHPRMAEAIAPGLDGLARVVVEPDDRARFARYVQRVLSPYLEQVGLAPRPGEPRQAALLRSRIVPILADEGRDARIRARARAAAEAFLAGDTSAWTAEEMRVLLPIASWDADAEHWERLRAALAAVRSPTLRRNLVTALGSFEAPALVERSLGLMLDGTLRAGDWRTLARALRRPALPAAWGFVREHHAALVKRLGPVAAAHLPAVARGFCSERERDAVEAFFRRQPPLPGRERNVALTLEDVERCAEARDTIAAPLVAWLQTLEG